MKNCRPIPFCLPALIVGLVATWAGAQDPAEPQAGFSPAVHDVSRYEQIWKKSPFIQETQIIQPSDGLEKRFALTGIAKIGERAVVSLLDRTSLRPVMVTLGQPTAGVELVSIAPESDPKLSTATIRVGSEQAVIRYDAASLANAGQAGGAAPQPPNNTGAVPAANQVRTPVLPATPQEPATNQVIRRRTIKLPPN